MFYKVVNAILLFGGKENANERKESLLSICRVQLFFCKDTTFPRNFQGFLKKLGKDEEKEKRRLPDWRRVAYSMSFLPNQ